ncbi:transposase [Streptomyces sviceus]|uniref:transposase n=1 Tax=Streptomyces sviceus TaxID=285530 RepID=UPI0036EE3946
MRLSLHGRTKQGEHKGRAGCRLTTPTFRSRGGKPDPRRRPRRLGNSQWSRPRHQGWRTPRRLNDLQARNCADQQDPQWRRFYAVLSGDEGTVNELAHAHQLRRCRYRGMAKEHVQHVLTALAVNIERLSSQEPDDSAYRPRPPTAFREYLEAHELPSPCWWRQGQ